MKEFIQLIWRLQAAKLNQHIASPVRVIDLHKGPELCVIMNVLQKILFGAKTDPMLTIFGNIEKMSRDIFTDANRVNYLEWLTFISNALILLGGNHNSELVSCVVALELAVKSTNILSIEHVGTHNCLN